MQTRKELTQAEKLHQESLRKKNFLQKWEQVYSLRQIAWQLKAARMRSQHPEWSEPQIQNAVKKIFLYGST